MMKLLHGHKMAALLQPQATDLGKNSQCLLFYIKFQFKNDKHVEKCKDHVCK